MLGAVTVNRCSVVVVLTILSTEDVPVAVCSGYSLPYLK